MIAPRQRKRRRHWQPGGTGQPRHRGLRECTGRADRSSREGGAPGGLGPAASRAIAGDTAGVLLAAQLTPDLAGVRADQAVKARLMSLATTSNRGR
jgi:hypothetical protein